MGMTAGDDWRSLAYTAAKVQVDGQGMNEQKYVEVDACDLRCPMPLLKAKRALNAMSPGEVLRVTATDSGSQRDFRVFAEQSGHALLSSDESEGIYTYLLRKT